MDLFKTFQNSINYNITEGSVVPEQQKYIKNFLLQHKDIKIIAETGFNGGLSTACMLSTREDIKVISFDICVHDYCISAKKLIDEIFPNRHILVTGDSMQSIATLKNILNVEEPIDFLFIDGNHIDPLPESDLRNLLKYLKRDKYLIIDDYCKFYGHYGVISAWNKMLNENLIEQIGQPIYSLDRGWIVGKKKE